MLHLSNSLLLHLSTNLAEVRNYVKCNRYFLIIKSFHMFLHCIHIADLSPLPTSIRKRHDTFAAAPHFKAFHSAPPPYHHPTKGIFEIARTIYFLKLAKPDSPDFLLQLLISTRSWNHLIMRTHLQLRLILGILVESKYIHLHLRL